MRSSLILQQILKRQPKVLQVQKKVRAGEKIPHSPCHGCLHKCNPAEIPYCITDALIHAAKGEVEDALLFCGANAYKATKIETVEEVVQDLFKA